VAPVATPLGAPSITDPRGPERAGCPPHGARPVRGGRPMASPCPRRGLFHASALADASGSVCVATASYSASAGSTVKEPPWSGLTARNARSSSVRIRRVPQRLARTTSDASAKPSSRSW
jgi:hypothetical protein